MVGKETPAIIRVATAPRHTLSFQDWDYKQIKRWPSKMTRPQPGTFASVCCEETVGIWLVRPHDQSRSRLHTRWWQLALLQPRVERKRLWAFSPHSPWPLIILVPRYLLNISGSLRTDMSTECLIWQCNVEFKKKLKKYPSLARKPFVLSLPA